VLIFLLHSREPGGLIEVHRMVVQAGHILLREEAKARLAALVPVRCVTRVASCHIKKRLASAFAFSSGTGAVVESGATRHRDPVQDVRYTSGLEERYCEADGESRVSTRSNVLRALSCE